MLYSEREVKYVKGVGEKTAQLLNKLGIFTLDALLNFYPKSYIDLSDITKLSDAAFFKGVNCVLVVEAVGISHTANRFA